MDGTIGTFTSEPTLDEVLKRSDFSCDSAACNPLRSTRVPVPLGVDLTRNEIASAIERSLPLKLRLRGCLTGASMRIPMAVSPTFY